MLKLIAAVLAVSTLGACASSSATPDAGARSALAPTGKLRAGMNLGNALFTTRDAGSDELRGVSVDILRELAARLSVPLEMVVHATPGDVADAAERNTWDVATLAIEQARARTIAFSPAMTEIVATYVVQADSKLGAVADVDAAGVRICAPEKAGYELYLTRTLRLATLVRPKSFTDCVARFNAREVDALAGLEPVLLETMAKLPQGRLLDGRFMTVNHGLGTPVARGEAGAAYLKRFVDDIKASGFIARSIARHQVRGLAAAPR